MFLQLPIHRKTDHHSGKTIVEAGNRQRSKGWHSHLHNTCTLFQVKI